MVWRNVFADSHPDLALNAGLGPDPALEIKADPYPHWLLILLKWVFLSYQKVIEIIFLNL